MNEALGTLADLMGSMTKAVAALMVNDAEIMKRLLELQETVKKTAEVQVQYAERLRKLEETIGFQTRDPQ